MTVTTASVPFKINLAWTDYPGPEVSQGGLVNDLDLQMISPSGKIHHADNTNKKPSFFTLQYTEKDEPDGQSADSMAVRFTPVSYPAHLDSVIFVYLNSEDAFSDVRVAVYDDNGSTGLPGTLLFKKDFKYIPPNGTTAVRYRRSSAWE